MSVESKVRESLKSVEDPEMKISVIELGLIYGINEEQREGGVHVEVDMTLTSPGCPIAPSLWPLFTGQLSRLKEFSAHMSI